MELDNAAAILAIVHAGLGFAVLQVLNRALLAQYPVRVITLGKEAPNFDICAVRRTGDVNGGCTRRGRMRCGQHWWRPSSPSSRTRARASSDKRAPFGRGRTEFHRAVGAQRRENLTTGSIGAHG